MRSATSRTAILGFSILFLLGLAACQHGAARSEAPSIATVVNQTPYALEIQENGDVRASLGVGETYNVSARTGDAAGEPVTVLVMAYADDGLYIGSAHRTFRPRGFVIWEVERATLNTPGGNR